MDVIAKSVRDLFEGKSFHGVSAERSAASNAFLVFMVGGC
jgi:hypothetical protein